MSLLVEDVHKSFSLGSGEVSVLRGASLSVAAGESLTIVGPSGSGKSTLLQLIGTLDRPDSGSITIDGQDPWQLSPLDLARFRNRSVGFVFQNHHLLPQYSVLENVRLPALAFADGARDDEARATDLLQRVGLGDRLRHRPSELSGGERQRAAVARALVNRPDLLLCDEPTGSLDTETAASVADLLFELHGSEQGILIVVTHSLELAARFQRRLELREGQCYEA